MSDDGPTLEPAPPRRVGPSAKPVFTKAPLQWVRRTWKPPARADGKSPRMATPRTARKVIVSAATAAALGAVGVLTGPDILRAVEWATGDLPAVADAAIVAAASFVLTRFAGRRATPDPQDELEANQ